MPPFLNWNYHSVFAPSILLRFSVVRSGKTAVWREGRQEPRPLASTRLTGICSLVGLEHQKWKVPPLASLCRCAANESVSNGNKHIEGQEVGSRATASPRTSRVRGRVSAHVPREVCSAGAPTRATNAVARVDMRTGPNTPEAQPPRCRGPSPGRSLRRRGRAPLGFPPAFLPGNEFRGMMELVGLTGLSLSFVHENMGRFLRRSRQLLTTGCLLLLVGVVVLSAATRRPCFHVHSGPWHTFKAGHMAAPKVHKACKLELRLDAPVRAQVPAESSATVSTYLPHQEAIPPTLSIGVQIHGFRSPPPLA